MTSPRRWSEPSSRTRWPTGWPGRSTWRRWPGSGAAGAICTRRAANCCDRLCRKGRAAVTNTRVFGIRHHGPGSARALSLALDEMQPDAVLIEGPPEAGPLLKLAGSPEMVPPVALLAYVPTAPAKAGFWPFAAFSPEW